MAFTLNAGEFDLGGGFIGLGNMLTGGVYSNTAIQNLLNTAGLEGISARDTAGGGSYCDLVFFRESDDPLTGTISFVAANTPWSFVRDQLTTYLSNQARFLMALQTGRTDGTPDDVTWLYLNSGAFISASYYFPNQNIFRVDSSSWRFLARDRVTSLLHYPTSDNGSIFAGAFVDTSTQWGLWAAGAVGSRSGYFDQRQGDFAIVLLRNGSDWYISVFSPAVSGSSSRNDSRMRSVNIISKAGQSGDDRFSELLLFRDQGSSYSERLGTVPGLIYVDMNRAENAALVVGDNLTIEPGVGTTYDLTNKGALIVAQWGFDISATISNAGSVFTVATISSPTSATLAAGNRNRWILENNQRIRFTATPPAGVSSGVDYWIINWDPVAFTFQIAESEGGAAIVPGSDASSTIVRYAPLIAMPCYKED